MLKNAITEIRQHPNRIIATLIAIAISVGFMAGAVTFIATVKESMAKSQNLSTSQADIIIRGTLSAENLETLRAHTGVKSAEPLIQGLIGFGKGNSRSYFQMYSAPADDFAWAKPTQGRWPNSATEVALSPQAAKELGAVLGDRLSMTGSAVEVTLVGITNDQKQPLSLAAVGYFPKVPVSDEPLALTVVVKAEQGTNLSDLARSLTTRMQSFAPDAEAKVAAEVREASLKRLTGDLDVMQNMLLAFGVIALVVGMIIIANTFNILIAQRRQQIGLLRAVGATTSQVFTRFLAEALVIGVLGSALGILLGIGLGAIGAWWLNAMSWGLALPWFELAAALLGGTLITVIASLAPSLRATRVSPIEALQTVPSEQQARRITRFRYLVCGTLALIGVFLTCMALTVTKLPIIWAIGAGAFLSLAVLGASPIFIPWLIRGLGGIFSFTGPTTRLATANGIRNPSRSAATATALMLAVGLIVTLQVAAATTRATAVKAIGSRYPIPIVLTSSEGDSLPSSVLEKASKVTGISDSSPVMGWPLPQDEQSGVGWRWVLAPGDLIQKLAPDARQAPPADDEAYVDPTSIPEGYKGEPKTITGPDGSVSLKLIPSRISGFDAVLVSPANLKKLVANPTTPVMWMSTSSEAEVFSTISQLSAIVEGPDSTQLASITGSFFEKSVVEQMVRILLITVSALLGVAVLIALIGVANTLGLSVIERRRESALLRALGMQRSKLRLMLLIEALLIAGVGALVGVGAGAFFGWLGASTAFRSVEALSTETLVYSIDWLYTVGLLLIAATAAALASVLPGRKAASATPTEALAND